MALANVVISNNIVVQCSTPTWELVERRSPTFRLKHLVLPNKIGCDKGKKCRATVIYASATDTTSIDSTSAKDAVNLGLSLFNQGRIKDAIIQFEKALTLDPNPDEAKAALYNKACCHASREEGKKTAEALRKALRDYNLNFSVILNDPDMAAFRAMPEFRELQDEARLGGDNIGGSFRRDLKLISEVQAPFRAVRKFFYAALCVAAGISTFFTIPRLFQVIHGGDGAPEFWETLGNTAINIGGIIILVALFIWENRKEEEQIAQISRDETLSRLPLRLSTNRVIELVQLRDTARPVILAGTKDAVNKAVQRAEKFRTELIERGVLIVPVVWRREGENPNRKKGFGGRRKLTTASSSSAVMAILEILKERFITLLKEGNLLIFKEDIKPSNFVEVAHDRELLNVETQQDSVLNNADAVNSNTTGLTFYQDLNWNTQRKYTIHVQNEVAYYGDNWGPPYYRNNPMDGWNGFSSC